jgi:hypothetical protein
MTVLKNHKNFSSADYEYLSGKGYSDKEIKAIWARDLSECKGLVMANKIDWTIYKIKKDFYNNLEEDTNVNFFSS